MRFRWNVIFNETEKAALARHGKKSTIPGRCEKAAYLARRCERLRSLSASPGFLLCNRLSSTFGRCDGGKSNALLLCKTCVTHPRRSRHLRPCGVAVLLRPAYDPAGRGR